MPRSRMLLLSALLASSIYAADSPMAFTLTIARPDSHTLHVTLRVDGLRGELQDFKMPVWSPGYYGIADYARSVSNFRVEDACDRSEIECRCLGLQRSYPSQTRHWASERLGGDRRVGGFGGGITAQS